MPSPLATATQPLRPTETLFPQNNGARIYQDLSLCFSYEVPSDWVVDGIPGGFASFGTQDNALSLRIVKGTPTEKFPNFSRWA
jgi:hypothetical protein